jgi:hypothetical protein
MADAHQTVVHNVCEVVSWEPVILYNNLVVHNAVFKLNFPMYQVLKARLTFWNLHPNNKRFPFSLLLQNLFFIVVLSAKPVVHSFRVLLTPDLHTHLCKSLCRAEAWVSIAILQCKSLNLPQAKLSRICRKYQVSVTTSKDLRGRLSHLKRQWNLGLHPS